MNGQARFTLRNRNPDILTCIANLSNDEVFTPPEFANRMLDTLTEAWAANHQGANLWADSTVRFLDPCTKSGVFLREITRRLKDGLEEQIPDLQERVNHILTKQVFGIGITQLTSLLARRSLYCSKHATGAHSIARDFERDDGNIWFERTEHEWLSASCRFCGASRRKLDRGDSLETHAYAFIHTDDIRARTAQMFGEDMQFDVIVGNPPYQLADGGGTGTSAIPIYNLFVEQAKKLNPRFLAMVIPSRWFTGGKGLDEFRASMLKDDRVRSIDDFVFASDVFPGVALKGGVCHFLWDRDNRGLCRVTTHFKEDIPSTSIRPLLEEGAEVFVRFNDGLSILKKVVAKEGGSRDSVRLPDEARFDRLVSTRRPFGFDSTIRGHQSKQRNDVLMYQNGGAAYLSRADVSTGKNLIDSWKIFIGFAAPGTGNKDTYPHKIISTPFLGEPGTICTETYLCIGPFEAQRDAESAISYLSCRLTRFLILLHKPSHNTTRKVYTFVPAQDWNRNWSDADLYAKYELTADEIAFVEKTVRPMELAGGESEPVDIDDDE